MPLLALLCNLTECASPGVILQAEPADKQKAWRHQLRF